VDEFVAQALVVALSVIVTTELAKRSLERATTEQDDAVETLLFDGSNEALSMRNAIRRFWRNRYDVHIVFLQDFSKLVRVLGISIQDEMRKPVEKAVVERSEIECDLFHEESVRVWCGC